MLGIRQWRHRAFCISRQHRLRRRWPSHRLWIKVYRRWITNNFPCKWRYSRLVTHPVLNPDRQGLTWVPLPNRVSRGLLRDTYFYVFLPPTNNWCYHDNNKVATRTKCLFRHPPTISNCMQNLSGGKIFSFPTLLDSYKCKNRPKKRPRKWGLS